jgi:hypothetical protein
MSWTPRDVVAVILAVCVGAAYSVALIVATLDPERLTYAGTALLYTVGGALVGAVISYLSGRPRKGSDDE